MMQFIYFIYKKCEYVNFIYLFHICMITYLWIDALVAGGLKVVFRGEIIITKPKNLVAN